MSHSGREDEEDDDERRERSVPNELLLNESDSGSEDEFRQQRRLPLPPNVGDDDDIRQPPSTTLQPNIEDCMSLAVIQCMIYIIRRYVYQVIETILSTILKLLLLSLTNTGILKQWQRVKLHIIRMRMEYFLITGCDGQHVTTVRLETGVSDLPCISFDNRCLYGTPKLLHVTPSELRKERADLYTINVQAGFVSLFLAAIRRQKLYWNGPRASHENMGLHAGGVVSLTGDPDVWLTALTKPYEHGNQLEFIGREVVRGDEVQNLRNVTGNRTYSLGEVNLHEPENEQLLGLHGDLTPRILLWYDRQNQTHMLTSAYTNKIGFSYDACFNVLYELDLSGISSLQREYLDSLAGQGMLVS